MRNKLTLAGLALAVVLFAGCTSAPTPVEQHFFSIVTNVVPVVQMQTNTVYTTNVVTLEVSTTNTVNDVTHVTIQPVRDLIVTADTHVSLWTNLGVTYTYTANTNAAGVAQTARAVGNLFGPFGDLIGLGVAGLFGLWGAIRSRKASQMTTGATVLSQSIEVLLNVIAATPQGQQLSDKLKLELARNQNAAGVLTEIAHLVETQVDNDAAKKAAKFILDTVQPAPASP